jgi:hypothetical protein
MELSHSIPLIQVDATTVKNALKVKNKIRINVGRRPFNMEVIYCRNIFYKLILKILLCWVAKLTFSWDFHTLNFLFSNNDTYTQLKHRLGERQIYFEPYKDIFDS